MPPSEVSAGYRKRTRWDGYDYQSDGLYFVTICTHERKHLFGTVDGDIMVLNRLGLIVEEEWWLSGKIRREIVIDSFIIMPDHLHGIVEIAQPDENRDESTHGAGCDKGRTPRSLGSFVGGFKSATTKRINNERVTPGARVWQRNYYDHVVRDNDDLARIQHYMATNPERWSLDREYPNEPYGRTACALSATNAHAVRPYLGGVAPKRVKGYPSSVQVNGARHIWRE